jgi:DNA helicase-4
LQLALPGGESFEFAEDRRLLYVALTRARKTETLITISHKESPFITELIKDRKLTVEDAKGNVGSSELVSKLWGRISGSAEGKIRAVHGL